MAKGDDIQQRLIKLAVDVMQLCDEIPESLTTTDTSLWTVEYGQSQGGLLY